VILPDLHEPSLGVVRARLITRRLVARGKAGADLPQVVATGRTGTGKTTLGNLLLGAADLLRATGHVDCTDAIYRIRFPRGLIYLDLPGVASDDRLENYNRAAFGLPQRPDWDRVDRVRVLDYQAGRRSAVQAAEQYFPAKGLPDGPVAPDVILYLVAPHKQLTRDEESYLQDLLRHCGEDRFVYVLNLYHDVAGARAATDADLADVRAGIAACCRAAGAVFDERSVAEVDCRTGDGLDALLAAMRRPLGHEHGRALADVISHQARNAPGTFRGEVQACVAAYAAALGGLVPESDADATDGIAVAARVLTGYAARLAGRPAALAPAEQKQLRKLARQVVGELRVEETEPVLVTRTKDVYRTVPVTETRRETDYSEPIYGWETVQQEVYPEGLDGFIRGVANMFAGGRFTDYRSVSRRRRIGYGTREVEVISGHRREYVRTDTYQEQDGTRVVSVSYQPLGDRGTALALTTWYLALRRASGLPGSGAGSIYRDVLAAVRAAAGEPARFARVLPADAAAVLDRLIAGGNTPAGSE
jgi:hypothetical protein